MPRKLKLNLDDLKIQSFITTLNDDERKKLKGGSGDCDSVATPCGSHCGCPTDATCTYCSCSCGPINC